MESTTQPKLYNLYVKQPDGSNKYKLALDISTINYVVDAFLKGKKSIRIKGTVVNIENPPSFTIYELILSNIIETTAGGIENDIRKLALWASPTKKINYKFLESLGPNVTENFLQGRDWGSEIKSSYYDASSKEIGRNVKGKIFISHSSKDGEIAKLFVDRILRLGFGLNENDIFCSSIDGLGIKSGDNFREVIKNELVNSKAVIQLLSDNYKESQVCLNEMGAAWVLSGKVIPLIIPPMKFDVGFIHTNTQQLQLNSTDDLLKLYEDHKELFLSKSSLDINRQITTFKTDLVGLLESEAENAHVLVSNEIVPHVLEVKRARNIFIDTVKSKPYQVLSIEIQKDRQIIVGVYSVESEFMGQEFALCILQSFAQHWQIIYNKTLDPDPCFSELVEELEFLTIENKPYVYFSRKNTSTGNGLGGFAWLEFVLFDLDANNVIKLVYAGRVKEDQKIEGEFDFTEYSQQGRPDLLKILEQRAKASKDIYSTPESYNLDDIENFRDKWLIENPRIYERTEGVINSFFYLESIFPSVEDYGDSETFQSNVTLTENEHYKIYFSFAGPLLGFSKELQKYFVIFIPEGNGYGGGWGDRSFHEVKFVSDTCIEAKTGADTYIFELSTFKFLRPDFSNMPMEYLLS